MSDQCSCSICSFNTESNEFKLDYKSIINGDIKYMTDNITNVKCIATRLSMLASILYHTWETDDTKLNLLNVIGKFVIRLELIFYSIDYTLFITNPNLITESIEKNPDNLVCKILQKIIESDTNLENITNQELIILMSEHIDKDIVMQYAENICKTFSLTKYTTIDKIKMEMLCSWLDPSVLLTNLPYIKHQSIDFSKYIRLVADRTLIFDAVCQKVHSELGLEYEIEIPARFDWLVENDGNPIENYLLGLDLPIKQELDDDGISIKSIIDIEFAWVQNYVCGLIDIEALITQCKDVSNCKIIQEYIKNAQITYPIYDIMYSRLVIGCTESIML